MGIRRYKEGDPLEVGQWVSLEPNLKAKLCTKPHQIEAVNKNSVTCEGTMPISFRAIRFVSDTKKEADSLYELSEKRHKEVQGTLAEIKFRYHKRLQHLLGEPQ